MTTPTADPSSIAFPAGPTYPVLLDSSEAFSWVRYKVWSADWYTRTLGELAASLGGYDRHIGIEMALDGALAALSGAFDAAVALLIRGAEDNIAAERRLEPRRYNWRRFKELSKDPKFPVSDAARLITDVDDALAGDTDPEPTGWLAVLRRLRNRPLHQATLARTWEKAQGEKLVVVDISAVPGDAYKYLQGACDQVSDLTERMTVLANALRWAGPYTKLRRTPWNP